MDEPRLEWWVIAAPTTDRNGTLEKRLREAVDNAGPSGIRMWAATGPSKRPNIRSAVRVQWNEELPPEEPQWPLGELDAAVDPEEVV